VTLEGSAALRIDAFLEAQAAELGAALNTRLAYARDLRDYAEWLGSRGLAFDTAARADVEDYLVDCDTRGLSRATRARRLSAIRQLYRFAFEEGWRSDNPAIQIRGPGRQKRLPTTLSEAEVERLIDAARTVGRNDEDRVRNRCLVELLYATGMRVSELVGLPAAAARGDPRMLLIRGKGGRERMVPLTDAARAALAEWLAVRDESRGGASRHLFPSRSSAGHLTRHRFYTLIKEIAASAGIDPSRVTPHTLRHAFATHLLAGGADLRSIQTLLGHADVATTEIYTHVLEDRLRELVLTRHPLADDAAG
jgi:integrase/recombinase XerD